MVTGSRKRTRGLRATHGQPGTGGLVLVGLIALLTQGTSGCAVAGMHPQPQAASTAVVPHDSESPVAETRITRYRDGHKVVTRDRSGTDITIQRAPGASPARDGREHPDGYAARFDVPWADQRFQRERGHGDGQAYGQGVSTTRDAFRQRMLDRLDGSPPRW